MAVILIVDDSRDERRMLETMIRHYTSHEVLTAENAEEAYSLVGKADLVFLDVMMPGEDGIQVFKKLRANKKTAQLPIIIISAYPDSIKNRLSPQEYLGLEVLSKPINPEKMANRLSAMLGVSAARQRLEEENFSEPEQLAILLAAIEQTGDGITLTDHNGRWLFHNHSEHEMFGYNREEFKQLKPEKIYSRDSLKLIQEEGIPQLREEGHWEAEVTAIKKGEQTFPVLLSLTQVRDNSGKFLGVMGITKDISILKKAFADLQQAQEALVSSERLNALAGLVEGIAHQFNNLLANILGNTQLLLQSASEPLAQRRLSSIERAAINGAEAVRRLQTFTLNTPHETSQKRLNLSELLEEVFEMTRPRWRDIAQRRGLSIEVEKNLQDHIVIEGNRDALKRAFANIIFNSIEALVEGGTIVIQSWEDQGWAYARITDNGRGMPPEVMEKAFEPFFTTERPGKSGMGLSETYGIIKKHQGDISLESKVDDGTTVTVSLPGKLEVETKTSTKKETTETIPKNTEPQKILIIDDDESILGILSDTLSRAGYLVTSRTDPQAGVDDLSSTKFDLIITDLGMKGINGLELARTAKQIIPSVPVALITGWKSSLSPDSEEVKAVDAVWGKPFDINQLLSECEKLIQR